MKPRAKILQLSKADMLIGVSSSLIVLMLFLTRCKKHPQALVDLYFSSLNNYRSDQLQTLLSDDFVLNLTYTDYFYKREDFFSRYVRNCKAYRQKARILAAVENNKEMTFLVEDNSDYANYLKIGPTKTVVTFRIKGNMIERITIDTTQGSAQFFQLMKERTAPFLNWLKFNFPNEMGDTLHTSEGLLLRRLKEYVDTQ